MKIASPVMITIFKKEFKEALRDRLVLLMNYIFPFILLPLVIIFTGETALFIKNKHQHEIFRFAIVGSHPFSSFLKNVMAQDKENKSHEKIELFIPQNTPLPLYPANMTKHHNQLNDEQKSSFLKFLEDNNLDLLIYLRPQKNVHDLHDQALLIFHEEGHPKAIRALQQLYQLIDKIREDVIKQRFIKLKLDEQLMRPYTIQPINISPTHKSFLQTLTNKFVIIGIIYFFILLVYYPALYILLGERKNKTISTLLLTPVKFRDIIWGKFLAVTSHGILGLLIYILVPLLMLKTKQQSTPTMLKDVSFFYWENVWNVLGDGLILISFLVLLSSLCFAMVSFAKNEFQGQSTLGAFFIFILFLTLPIVLLSEEAPLNIHSFIPYFNSIFYFSKKSFHIFSPFYSIGCLVTNLAATFLVIQTSTHIYEQVTFSEEGSSKKWIWRQLKTPNEFNPFMASLFYFFIFSIIFISGFLFGKAIIFQMWFNPLFMLFSASLVLYYFQFNLLQMLKAKLIPCLLSIILGITLGLVSYRLSSTQFFQEVNQVFQELIPAKFNQVPLILKILLMGLLPGLIEELIFRGIIWHSFFTKYSPQLALFFTAILFALIHFSLLRFLPTFLIGLILGLVRWKGKSLTYSILVHVFYNTSVIVFMST